MTIAITGATGQLGRLVIQQLTATVPSAEIVALVRSPEKAADLGVSVRTADYTQPATLTPALAGIDTLLLISGNEIGQRTAQHANVIAAAQRAGVKHIVYTSLLHADKSSLSLAPEHLETENILKDSGLSWTILRNGWYSENYTAAVPSALALGALYGSAGEGKIASAPRADYAAAAALILTTDGHQDKVYELAGDTAWTLSELAAEISAQSSRDITYRNLPQKEYAAALQQAGLPVTLADAIASWDISASQGALFDNGHQLSALLGRPTRALAVSVGEALAQR